MSQEILRFRRVKTANCPEAVFWLTYCSANELAYGFDYLVCKEALCPFSMKNSG